MNPSSPTRPATLTAPQAARFLQQASFASTPDDIARAQALGYSAWIQQEFERPVSQSNWDWLLAHGYDDEEFKGKALSTTNAIWQRLFTAEDVLRQRIALALSEFFVISTQGVGIPYRQFAMAAWWDLLCTHAFGNFRQLLEAVTLSPAMGRYLNTAGNRKEDPRSGRQPDENYAREVLQLFSIGLYQLNTDGSIKTNAQGQPLESYTQDDISQLARVFTGWFINLKLENLEYARAPMSLNPAQHSMLAVHFLNCNIPANTEAQPALRMALDSIFTHPNVGPFFGRQMIQRLVTSNPSPAYVERVTAAFNDNGHKVRGDMQAIIRAILLDDEARSEAHSPGFGKLREPMLRFIQWGRSFKTNAEDGKWDIGDLRNAGAALGQQPLGSPTVFNFFRPGYTPPNSDIAAQSMLAPEFQLVHETSVASYMNFMQHIIVRGRGDVHPNYSTELALADDAAALMKHINLLLCAGRMSERNVNLIRTAITSIDLRQEDSLERRVHAAIFMTLCSPDYLIQT